LGKIHTTETEATRSYIRIPASAKARLAHDMTTGRSPVTNHKFNNITARNLPENQIKQILLKDFN
jgi:hypothetical protein